MVLCVQTKSAKKGISVVFDLSSLYTSDIMVVGVPVIGHRETLSIAVDISSHFEPGSVFAYS